MRFRTAVQMVVADVSGTSLLSGGTPAFNSAKFWIDFAFVSDEERAELVAAPQTYLVTQIMRTTSDAITFGATAGDTNFTLQFNLPATDLIWLVQDDTRTNGDVENNDWFNFGLNDGAAATDFFTQAVLKINNVNREEARNALYFRVSTIFFNNPFFSTLVSITNSTLPFFTQKIKIELPSTKDPHCIAKQLLVRIPILSTPRGCKYYY